MLCLTKALIVAKNLCVLFGWEFWHLKTSVWLNSFWADDRSSHNRLIITRLADSRKSYIFICSKTASNVERVKQFLLIWLHWVTHIIKSIFIAWVIYIWINTRAVLIVKFRSLVAFINGLVFSNALICFIIASITTCKINICLRFHRNCWTCLLRLWPLIFYWRILKIYSILFVEVCITGNIATELDPRFLFVDCFIYIAFDL